jgi:putative methyltransferase (TIGR04325 family)
MSCKGPVKVLDFAGGTGVIYYRIRPYLSDPSNVTWDVFDINKEGLEMGRAFDPKDKNIQFYSQLPDRITNCYDVVYISTALHHFSDYRTNIKELLDFQPTYFVLTRLIAGEVPSYVTSYLYPSGKRTPYRVINVLELSEFFNENGYKLIFKAPSEDRNVSVSKDLFSKDVPEDHKIEFTLTLVFRKD